MEESLISLQQDEIDLNKKIAKLKDEKDEAKAELKSRKPLLKVMFYSCLVGVTIALVTGFVRVEDKLLIEYLLSDGNGAIPFYKFALAYGSLAVLSEGVIPGLYEHLRRKTVKTCIESIEDDEKCYEKQLEDIRKVLIEHKKENQNSLIEELDDFDIAIEENDDYDKKISDTDDFDLEDKPKSLKRSI